MTRKIISALLALAFCLSLAVSVSAEPKAIDFVVDELGYLTDEELYMLNDLAAEIYAERGIGIFFLFIDTEDVTAYDISPLVGDLEHFYVMIENETHWYTEMSGMGTVIDEEAKDYLRNVYDAADTYVGGVEAFLLTAAEYFPLPEAEPVETNPAVEPEPTVEETQPPVETAPAAAAEEFFLADDADLLTDTEEAELIRKLTAISQTFQAQIVIGTIGSMEGGDIDEFLNFFYDESALGYGEKRDGVLLLVCMDPREYRILSNGFAADAITTSTIDSIGDAIVSDLTDGNYYRAFSEFADQCEYYLNGHINGFPFDVEGSLIVSLGIGMITGLIVSMILKGQLKTVRKQEQANVYTKPGSMQVTIEKDRFLYRSVSKTAKESKSSSSDSGSSRNTGGGSF